MSNVLVTGGMGFIGHNVVSKLESLGHNVFILDNMTNYGVIPDHELHYLMHERKKKTKTYLHYKYDICDSNYLKWLFINNNFDVVIHLASYPRQKVVAHNPIMANKTMVEGLLNLLESSKNHNVGKFVYISSSMVYGDFLDGVKEDSVCAPNNLYGIFKLTGEAITKDYARNYNMAYTIVRPSAVYGPLDVIDRVVAKFIINAMYGLTLKVNGANEKLDFTYVDDVAEGIVLAALSENADNKTYNITRGVSRTILEAAELIVKMVGNGNIEVCDKDNTFPSRGSLDITSAINDIGYSPKIDIETGFERYYQWLKNNSFYNKYD